MFSKAWPAPAKLNLFLHIIGRNPDGYHQLQTLFQLIDLADYLDFEILDENIITRQSNLSYAGFDDDLVVRAAKKLKARTQCSRGVRINILKNIPVGGGLGGGSTDAATTLVALNHLWQTRLSHDDLMQMSLELGADVPFFVAGVTAWGEGIGEKITPVVTKDTYFLVVYPRCHISTAAVFRSSDLTRDTPAITIADFLDKGGHNDLEGVVRKEYTEVAEAFELLDQYARFQLTGTGSCLFARFADKQAASQVKDNIPDKWQVFLVKSINRSPLHSRITEETR